MKVIQIFRCFIFIILISNASGEYVPWMDVFKEVVKNGLIFPARLPPCNSQNCINGKCMPMNDCECFDGFEGIKCDRPIPSFTTSLPAMPTTTTTEIPFTTFKNITVTPNISTLSEAATVPPNTFDISTTTVTPNISSNIILPEATTVSQNNFDLSTTDVTIIPKIIENVDPVTTAIIPLNVSNTVIPNVTVSTPVLSLNLKSNISNTVIPTISTTKSLNNITVAATSTPDQTTTVTPTSTIVNSTLAPFLTTTVSSSSNIIAATVHKCPFADYCKKVAKNGICDLRCNIKECNFDNGDCIDKNDNENDSDEKCPEVCIQQLKNGICNEECNIKSCNFDATKCFKSSNPISTPIEKEDDEKVKLKIIYETNPSNFDETKATKLLEKFSQLSNIPNIHFSTTDSGDFEIYKWTKESGKGELIKLQSLSMLQASNLEGVEIYFDVDFSQCKSSDANCRFQNAKDVESYINTAPVYEVTSELGAPVYEARIIYPEKENSNSNGYIFGMIFIGFALIIGVIGGLENANRKRKRSFIVEDPQEYKDYRNDFTKRPRYDPQIFYEYYRSMRIGKTSEADLLERIKTIYATYRSLEWRTERGETLLHWAIRLNHCNLAFWMLDKIDDINAADNGGSTYLFDSIKNTKASFNIFQQLLQIPGIEVNTFFGPNLTPLKQCAESDNLLPFLKLLCQHPSINIRSIGFIKDRKCKRQNVLHHAAGYGSVETIKYLLQFNVNKRKNETNLIAVLDDNVRTPLVYALESEQWEAAKVLIQNMKPVNLQAGIPALTVAKHCGNDEIYRLIEARIPKEKSPPPPPKKVEPVKSSALEYMKAPTATSFGILPITSTDSIMMPPPQGNMGYGNQQYYQNQSPPIMVNNQQPSPVIIQQQQQFLPPQMQYQQPQSQVLTSQSSSMIVPQQSQHQQLLSPIPYPQPQVQASIPRPSAQYTHPGTSAPPTATVSQYVQQEHYNANPALQTLPTRQQRPKKLSRMQSQPIIAQIPYQQQQHQLQYQNQYASMQSIPSSSTAHFVQPQMPQQMQSQQKQQWQQQNTTIQYSQEITGTSYLEQPSNYANYSQFLPPERREQPLKRAQSHAYLSATPQYYQEFPQQSQYHPSNNIITNYSNYQQMPLMPPQQQLQRPLHQPLYQQQQQPQEIPQTYFYPQSSTPNHEQQQQPTQYSMTSNYQEITAAAASTTLMPQPNLSPSNTFSDDSSGYHTGSPESFLNYTNDSSFQQNNNNNNFQ